MKIGEAYVEVKADTSGFSRDVNGKLRNAQGQFVSEGTRAGQGYGKGVKKGFSGFGKSLLGGAIFSGVAVGAAALGAGLVKSIDLAKDFDLTIRQVGVQTGQTGKGLESLRGIALKMGADTAFSAADASAAMLELAKGGMTAAQIKGGALKTTLTLAAAGGIELGNAAGYVVQGLTTFGLKASQSKEVAVALAGGANASTASVESLGQALSQVGPGAKNAGLSLQETVAALAAFDNAGIKGSDAGTSLKTMLTRLVPSTKKSAEAMKSLGLDFTDSKGNIDDLATVAEKLKKGLGNLSEEQRTAALTTIFGSDAARAASVMMDNGRKGIEKYVKATKNQSTVQKMANTAMGGASGALESLKGSVETVGIKIGSALLPSVAKGANGISKFISSIGSGKAKTGSFADEIGKIGPKFVTAMGGSKGFRKSLSDMSPMFTVLKSVGKAALRVFIASIPVVVGLFKGWAKYIGFVGRTLMSFWNDFARPVLKLLARAVAVNLKGLGLMAKGMALLAPPGVRGRLNKFADALLKGSKQADRFANSLHKIKPPPKINISTNAEEQRRKIRDLQSAISHLSGKSIDIVTHYINIGNKPKSPVPGSGGNNALGGTVPRGYAGWAGERGPELLRYSGNGRTRVETASRSAVLAKKAAGTTTFIIRDADGALIGRMRGEAAAEVDSAGAYAGTMGRMR